MPGNFAISDLSDALDRLDSDQGRRVSQCCEEGRWSSARSRGADSERVNGFNSSEHGSGRTLPCQRRRRMLCVVGAR
jgi:hypothetical protein